MADKKKLIRGMIWVVVADSARADIYSRLHRYSQLESVQSLTEPKARAKEHDFTADAPGRSFDSAGRGRHAMEPDHTSKQHLRETFAHEIAALLESGRQANRFKHLIIVAAPAFLGELRAQLSAATAKCVLAEFDKDLAGRDTAAVAALIDS